MWSIQGGFSKSTVIMQISALWVSYRRYCVIEVICRASRPCALDWSLRRRVQGFVDLVRIPPEPQLINMYHSLNSSKGVI